MLTKAWAWNVISSAYINCKILCQSKRNPPKSQHVQFIWCSQDGVHTRCASKKKHKVMRKRNIRWWSSCIMFHRLVMKKRNIRWWEKRYLEQENQRVVTHAWPCHQEKVHNNSSSRMPPSYSRQSFPKKLTERPMPQSSMFQSLYCYKNKRPMC